MATLADRGPPGRSRHRRAGWGWDSQLTDHGSGEVDAAEKVSGGPVEASRPAPAVFEAAEHSL